MEHASYLLFRYTQTSMNSAPNKPTVHIIDDDDAVRNSISMSLAIEGLKTQEFASAVAFLSHYKDQPGCIVTDIEMPEMSGIELQRTLKERNIDTPIIFITGEGNIPMSVQAMKSGAIDFIEKPFVKKDLLHSIHSALAVDTYTRELKHSHEEINCRCELLTTREKQIMFMLVKDHAKLTNKDIAKLLNISKRTVEVHRSSVMSKMHAKTRSELVELSKSCDLEEFQDHI